MSSIIPVILAGGVGSRLWPLSREDHPKQFIKLKDGQSLIQKTYLRAIEFCTNIKEIVTVTNRDFFFYTKDEYQKISDEEIFNSFILEPFGRSSTAAIALAAHYVKEKYGEESILLILPADHLISDQVAFKDVVNIAYELACFGSLVTFGIKPNSPKTGYGYIESDGNIVKRFIEKPNLEKAKEYIKSGNHYWNSGMFCMKVSSIITEMSNLCNDILEHSFTCFNSAKKIANDQYLQIEIGKSEFEQVRNISIDYAIFEKSNNVAIVPCEIGWSDIGSWTEFGELFPVDSSLNNVYGDVVLESVSNCIIYSQSKLVAGLGIDNLVIADTGDALLIASRDYVQDVRKVVKVLKENGNNSYKFFSTVYRPWGSYTILQDSENFKIKRIEVNPYSSLSLQSHEHRSEHWIVVSGVAKVTNGDRMFELSIGESTFIPARNKHRLENLTSELLVIIEVQCGNYLGEDDIIRYEDTYGRVSRS